MALNISYDENLIAQLRSQFALREPNAEALIHLVRRLESGDFEPQEQLTLDLATGVGKTYIMAAFVEYLRRQGVMNVMIVTPNKVVQDKTVADFNMGSRRYIDGFDVPPTLVTPDDVQMLRLGDAWKTYSLVPVRPQRTSSMFNNCSRRRTTARTKPRA